jgi:hypothetical protein
MSACSFSLLHAHIKLQTCLETQQVWRQLTCAAHCSRDAAGRLMALAEELCEALWALCDQRHDASEAERRKAALDACIAECVNMVAQGTTALVQAEVDRCAAWSRPASTHAPACEHTWCL